MEATGGRAEETIEEEEEEEEEGVAGAVAEEGRDGAGAGFNGGATEEWEEGGEPERGLDEDQEVLVGEETKLADRDDDRPG